MVKLGGNVAIFYRDLLFGEPVGRETLESLKPVIRKAIVKHSRQPFICRVPQDLGGRPDTPDTHPWAHLRTPLQR